MVRLKANQCSNVANVQATIPIDFEPRLVELHINQTELDKEFKRLWTSEGLNLEDSARLSKQAAKFGHLVKAQDRIQKTYVDIVTHFKEHVEPNGFKGQVVVYERVGEACHLYKREIDKLMQPAESAVVMTVDNRDPEEWKKHYSMTDDEQTNLVESMLLSVISAKM